MTTFPLEGPEGKRHVTLLDTIEPLDHISRVKWVLEAGRSLQIRGHMKCIGHPLLNDSRYGDDKIVRGGRLLSHQAFINKSFERGPRQALHHRTLGFRHPETGEEMQFPAPVPPDMWDRIERRRTYSQGNSK